MTAQNQNLNFLWLELTNKCNLSCQHCYADSSPKIPLYSKMKYEDWCSAIKQAYEMNCTAIQFIGGEPTIYPKLNELIEYSNSIGVNFIEVYTNGISIKNEQFETFKKYNVSLAFSFYSHISENHDKVTNLKGSQLRTLVSIERARELGLNIRVGIIETEHNKNEIQETYTYVKNLGIKNVGIDWNRGIGRGDGDEKKEDPYSQLCGNCSKGKLAITPDGDIYPCVFSRFAKVGNFAEGIYSAYNGKELTDFKTLLETKYFTNCTPSVEIKDNTFFNNCSPDNCIPDGCKPDECHPDIYCKPDCSPNDSCSPDCSPNCSPNCSPYCNPNCNPFDGCKPK